MITGYVYGGEQIQAKLSHRPVDVRAALAKGITRAILEIERHVKQDKLSGQVLKVKTGTLRAKVNARIPVTETASGVEGIVGTKVSYAAVHEYGFAGTVNVREHLRKSKLGKAYTVGAHSRNVNLPERSFLRSALNDLRANSRDEIETAINRAIREKFA